MLAKLNVRQKLTFLLMLPLIAVFFTSIPFALSQINTVVAADVTVDVARRAHLVGSLIQDIQEERLLGIASLVSDNIDQSAFSVRVGATSDSAAEVEKNLVLPRDVKLKTAIGGLRSLINTRQSILMRNAFPVIVFNEYHKCITNLIDALLLTRQDKSDPAGILQMSALDALLRTNEEIGQIGSAIVLSGIESALSVALEKAHNAHLMKETYGQRFRDWATPEDNTLLNYVEQGPTARKLDSLLRQLSSQTQSPPIMESFSAAHTMIALTRIQQERIIRLIADRAETRASNSRFFAGTIIGGVALLVIAVVFLSVAVSRSVSIPLRKLIEAARHVADIAATELVRIADSEIDEPQPPKLAAVDVQTSDEIGEMAEAFNRVQLTAMKLMDQQVATRRNTAVMFANIARRTRSMVSRQLTFIDDLERNEQNERLLSKLYRLDHLTTRLHRSADSLLVVSGVREDERIVSPAPLPEVIRSAVAEIEGYQNVQTGMLASVIIAPQLVPDLRLVLAELLENATAFSPPGSPVEVFTHVDGACQISVVDHGIGMSTERLAEENRRLVERERLDVVPTSVLGLFVVGRLARRHGLSVDLSRTDDQGVTATVTIPVGLFHDGAQQAKARLAAHPTSTTPTTHAPSASMIEALSLAHALSSPSITVTSVKPPVVDKAPAHRRNEEPSGPGFVEPERVSAGPGFVEPEISQSVEPGFVEPEVEPEISQPVEPGFVEPERVSAGPGFVEPEISQPVEPVFVGPEISQPVEPVFVEPEISQPVATSPGISEASENTEFSNDNLAWFVPPPDLPSSPSIPGSVSPETPENPLTISDDNDLFEYIISPEGSEIGESAHRGLTRRQPGGHLPSFGIKTDDFKTSSVLTRDAVAERAELEAFAMGTAQAAAARLKRAGLDLPEPSFHPQDRSSHQQETPRQGRIDVRRLRGESVHSLMSSPTPSSGQLVVSENPDNSESNRSGLKRRMPGTHLSEYLRSTGSRTATPARTSNRDADAERAALDSFIDGLTRAQSVPDQTNHR